MSNTIYLYLKTHNITGLKYLGKTVSKDPYAYKGSGVIWRAHLKEHGDDVSTTILEECDSESELESIGEYYSDLWNIVESKDFANMIPESGTGNAKGIIHSDEARAKLSKAMKGKKNSLGYKHSAETRAKMAKAKMGNTNSLGYKQTDEHRAKIGKAQIGNTHNRGRIHTNEARAKMSAAAAKRREENVNYN